MTYFNRVSKVGSLDNHLEENRAISLSFPSVHLTKTLKVITNRNIESQNQKLKGNVNQCHYELQREGKGQGNAVSDR